ncbi:MAG: excinuclease ABC subunit UvrB [bacterium]
MEEKFKLVSNFSPKGDQPQAIKKLSGGILKGDKEQVLLGVTGSGKTYTIANVIAGVNRPTLIISHNKTLAAQLYSEFKQFFPQNAVEYFVSYYDYYQPEAYIPQSDTYIEKDSSINEQLDRLRLKATTSLIERRDVIVVASVSCIYNIGSPGDFRNLLICLEKGSVRSRDQILRELISIQYERNDIGFARGKFRVRGDTVEVFPAYLETALKIELFGDSIERITEINPLTGKVIREMEKAYIYPATHFVTTGPKLRDAMASIRAELDEHLKTLRAKNKLLEAQRLEERTNYDLEMMAETGYCHGVENYSRHLSSRASGERPECLLDYFPRDFLVVIDESHVSIPQINGMYNGDRSRKQTLVNYGFRLPSALDNRPLKFGEFENLLNQTVYISATPGSYELKKTGGAIVEQVIRPTGLVDPEVIVKPTKNQVDDLIEQVKNRVRSKERVLVTTLTKRMAEDLCDYLLAKKIKVQYLHSGIQTLDRIDILKALRKGEFDCLVGVNLLREGLDLPEVSLVAVLDADKEGFLRSATSLIQVCGRAARNINGQIIMYADTVTGSMIRAMNEMNRRRIKQVEYNKENNIIPATIKKAIREDIEITEQIKRKAAHLMLERGYGYDPQKNALQIIKDMEKQMYDAAEVLDFELAALLRDRIRELKKMKVSKPKAKKHLR